MDIIGKYEIDRMMYSIDNCFNLYSKNEINNNIDQKLFTGEIDNDEAMHIKRFLDTSFEFTDNNKIIITNDNCDKSYNDEFEWKYEDGKYYYTTNDHSNWNEIIEDEDDYLLYLQGILYLKKK